MELIEKRLSGETVYDGRIFKVERDSIELPGGKQSVREILRHNGGVCVAAIDQNGEIYFVRQYRYAFASALDELPAGKLEAGEQPDLAAARELREETGYTAKNLKRVAVSYPSPGYTDEKLYLYIATELSYVGQQLDEDEFLNVYKQPLKEAVARVLSGEIHDAKSQTLILLADKYINGGYEL